MPNVPFSEAVKYQVTSVQEGVDVHLLLYRYLAIASRLSSESYQVALKYLPKK